ncbi:dihydroorotase [Methanomicrobiaceae archaeon CYW5]|uniref:dihydroorotase n=1 Tax=Methanovulcanius yangii TaxID=1789227 RepID=UPI0029C9CE19|nr:dihydroorotase [Methanovulcanius yangii]MBT8507683.1 dihydroorotase [Methanovulcanius yangii]
MPASPDLIIRNALIPGGRIVDITICEGRVVHVGAGGTGAEQTIDARGNLCLPGAIDMHVHMRGGSRQAYKETWSTGTISAVAGGVTMVVDQPNTLPPLDTRETFRNRVAEAREGSFCRFGINGAVTPHADLAGLREEGALAFGETFAAASSYGEAIGSGDLKRCFKELHRLDALVTIHCEEVREGRDVTLATHSDLRPGSGEAAAVSSICDLFSPGQRSHFCHLSSAASFRAACTSFEVMPHHLFLSQEMFAGEDAHGKVNPPIRTEKERKELWALWDRIPVIASDHAPHSVEEKSGPFEAAPAGLPGVETMVPLLLAAVYDGRVALASVLEKVVSRPAEILRIPAPGLVSGAAADIAIYPKESIPITAECLHSRAGWTPYEGMSGVFPEVVVCNGRMVYDGGEFTFGAGEWVRGQGYKCPQDE